MFIQSRSVHIGGRGFPCFTKLAKTHGRMCVDPNNCISDTEHVCCVRRLKERWEALCQVLVCSLGQQVAASN